MSNSEKLVWFVDTSALMTAAVSPDLETAIRRTVETDAVVLLDIVVQELDRRAGIDGRYSPAALARNNIDWLGAPEDTDNPHFVDRARDVQWELSGHHDPDHPLEHWGESMAIGMMEGSYERGVRVPLRFLCDDHQARLRAHNGVPTCLTMSTRKLLWYLVHDPTDPMTAADASRITEELKAGGRGEFYSPAEFADSNPWKGLRRVGMP